MDGSNSNGASSTDAVACKKLGDTYLQAKLIDKAIGAYAEALRINLQFADAYYDKGLACEGLGRKTEAIEAYRQFLLCAPTEDSHEIERAKQSISELGG